MPSDVENTQNVMPSSNVEILKMLAAIQDPAQRAAIAQAKAKIIDRLAPAPKLATNPSDDKKREVAEKEVAFATCLVQAEQHRAAGRFAEALAALNQAAALKPEDPRPPFHLCSAQTKLGDVASACRAALQAVARAPGKHLGVVASDRGAPQVPRGIYPQIGLRAAVMAFDLLLRPECDGVARPTWWTDKQLLSMSARALADTPDSPYAADVRANVLLGVEGSGIGGKPRGWPLGARSSAQLREAAVLLKRQASMEAVGSSAAMAALARSAAVLQAAVRQEAEEAEEAAAAPARAGAGLSSTSRVRVPAVKGGSVKDGGSSGRVARLEAKKAQVEEQLAALEQQLAAVGVEIS